MQNEESLSLSYSFRRNEEAPNRYAFQTLNNIIYEVIFKPSPYVFEQYEYGHLVYEFSIVVAQNPLPHKPPFDKNVAPTIADIFTNFYEKAPNTLSIYICDSSDGKQQIRHLKFHRWFEHFHKKDYVKIDHAFRDSDGVLYPVSLIIKAKNPHLASVANAFLLILAEYNDGK